MYCTDMLYPYPLQLVQYNCTRYELYEHAREVEVMMAGPQLDSQQVSNALHIDLSLTLNQFRFADTVAQRRG